MPITKNMSTQQNNNPKEQLESLFIHPDTPLGAYPFDVLKEDDFAHLIDEAIAQEEEDILTIERNADSPSFENTILALEESGKALEALLGAFYNLLHAHSSEKLMALSEEFAPKLTALRLRKLHSPILFKRIHTLYEQRESLALSKDEKRLMYRAYESFVDSGAALNEAQRENLGKVFLRLSKSTTAFGNQALKDQELFRYFLPLGSAAVESLPQSILNRAKSRCMEERQESGYLFALTAPEYQAVMSYSPDEALRKTFYYAWMQRGNHPNCYNTTHLIRTIIAARLEIAQILGYSSYAAYALKDRMLSDPEEVIKLLNELETASHNKCQAELRMLAAQDPTLSVTPWNIPYLFEQIRRKQLDYNREEVRAYFPADQAVSGVLRLAEQLYRIHFIERSDIPVYDPCVKTFEVWDNQTDRHLGLLYLDLFARSGKRSGAWMNNLRDQDEKQRPHILIVMNFTPPEADRPALLYLEDVHTLLHEFGHAMHGMLSQVRYKSLSGTNVTRDFVELPSQIMENWLYEPEFLQSFAKHYQTSAPLPQHLIDKILATRCFQSGYATQRQLSFGFLDMAYHSITSKEDIPMDIEAFEKDAMKQATCFPLPAEGCLMSSAFGHLFAGGYAAGYYGYKWSEVLAADAFSLFQEKGIYNTLVADCFRREILEKGDTEEAMVLYERFRGRKPLVSALIHQDGLRE